MSEEFETSGEGTASDEGGAIRRVRQLPSERQPLRVEREEVNTIEVFEGIPLSI